MIAPTFAFRETELTFGNVAYGKSSSTTTTRHLSRLDFGGWAGSGNPHKVESPP